MTKLYNLCALQPWDRLLAAIAGNDVPYSLGASFKSVPVQHVRRNADRCCFCALLDRLPVWHWLVDGEWYLLASCKRVHEAPHGQFYLSA